MIVNKDDKTSYIFLNEDYNRKLKQMEKENYLINILKKRIIVEQDDKIFYFLNEDYNRKSKLNKLLNNNNEIVINSKYNQFILEQDLRNKYFFVDRVKIWDFYESKFYNYAEINEFINSTLCSIFNCVQYKTFWWIYSEKFY